MRLSTMILMYLNKSREGHNYLNAIRRLREIGFECVDPTFSPIAEHQTEMSTDRWRQEADLLLNEAVKLGVTFPQIHLPYPKAVFHRKRADDPGCEKDPWFLEAMDRAIEFSGMAGVRWGVVHPLSTLEPMAFDKETDIAYNLEYYAPLLEKADRLGVGLAFENLCDHPEGRRFGVTAGELIDLVKAFDSDRVGICWDFGHGRRTYLDQLPAVRKVGPYLHATHVDDNYGTEDLHMPPFQGKNDWEGIMGVVKEIGYRDAFTLETRFTQLMPECVKDLSCSLMYELGKHLISMAS